jgi:hypothetical protein
LTRSPNIIILDSVMMSNGIHISVVLEGVVAVVVRTQSAAVCAP